VAGKLDVAELRAEAERCRRLAGQMTDRALRNVLEEAARTYDALADEVERLNGSARSSG